MHPINTDIKESYLQEKLLYLIHCISVKYEFSFISFAF